MINVPTVEESGLVLILSVPRAWRIKRLLSYDQCSHNGGVRSGIYTVSAKCKEKTKINVPIMEKICLILILSLCQCQEHRKDNCFCLYDPWSYRARVGSIIFTVSTKSQEKITVVL